MARRKKEETKEIETNNNILLPEKVDMDEIRNELKSYVDERVTKTFIDEIEKTNKKLVREKTKKIIWRNIIILILLLIICFLVFVLYRNNYFDKYFSRNNDIVEKEEKDNKKEEVKVSPTPTPTATPKVPTQEELKKEYGDLLDNYYVTDSSIYLVDYYEGKLTDDMMKYMTLNSFNFSTIEKEEDYNIIKESTFKTMFEKLFDETYKGSTFNYDENKVRYVKGIESYMTSEYLVREENYIRREIKDIKLDGKKIIITTVEGVVKDNKIYNVLSNDEIGEYKEGLLIKNEDKLNKLVYTFQNNKLISLSK